jgi:hypothetical protein
MTDGPSTTASGTGQINFRRVLATEAALFIAPIDDMHASEMESSRLRYDDRPSERCRSADRKTRSGSLSTNRE